MPIKKQIKVSKNLKKVQHLHTTAVVSSALTRPVSGNIQASTADWAKGIVGPFESNGPRVPDLFCYPTITAQSRGVNVYTSSAAGVIQGAILPYPTLSYVNVEGPVSSSSMFQYVGKPCFAATTSSNLANLFSNYRVVSVGVRIRNLIAPLNATGRVILAPFISSQAIPGPNSINNAAVDGGNLFQAVTGLASSGANLLELPYAKEYSIQDLISGTATWSTRPVSAQCYTFHAVTGTNQAINSIYGLSQTTVSGVSNTSAVDSASNFSPNNYTGLVVYAVGLPPSITCLELEYVYHYEGTPAMGLTAGAVMPEQSTPSPVDISGMSSMLRAIAASPPINIMAETALGGFGKTAMSFLKRL